MKEKQGYQKSAKKHADKGCKWVTDMWVARTNECLLPPDSLPQCLQEVADSSTIGDRELDWLRFQHQKGATLEAISRQRPALELKHSASRLKSSSPSDCVSTLLPGSRQLLLRTCFLSLIFHLFIDIYLSIHLICMSVFFSYFSNYLSIHPSIYSVINKKGVALGGFLPAERRWPFKASALSTA